jgi:hypothetical protein
MKNACEGEIYTNVAQYLLLESFEQKQEKPEYPHQFSSAVQGLAG